MHATHEAAHRVPNHDLTMDSKGRTASFGSFEAKAVVQVAEP